MSHLRSAERGRTGFVVLCFVAALLDACVSLLRFASRLTLRRTSRRNLGVCVFELVGYLLFSTFRSRLEERNRRQKSYQTRIDLIWFLLLWPSGRLLGSAPPSHVATEAVGAAWASSIDRFLEL